MKSVNKYIYFIILNLNNQARSLFSIDREDRYNEKKFIKKLLETLDYRNWLNDDFRISNVKKIKNEFLKIVDGSFVFREHEKYLNYQDFLMLGGTTVNNYKSLKKTNLLLIEEIGEALVPNSITRA